MLIFFPHFKVIWLQNKDFKFQQNICNYKIIVQKKKKKKKQKANGFDVHAN